MDVVRVGILFSTQGAYGALGRDCRLGAELAVEHLQAEGKLPFKIEPVYGDPAGCADRYMTQARSMMLENGCRHIFGTVTSQARKDVIPVRVAQKCGKDEGDLPECIGAIQENGEALRVLVEQKSMFSEEPLGCGRDRTWRAP